MNKLYGNLPVDLGTIDIPGAKDEMMYYLYLPVKLPGMRIEIVGDERLEKFQPLLDKVYLDNNPADDRDWYKNKYVYLTVKCLYVSAGCTGQRLGWHSDGFMTNDINYIWYTDSPTTFYDAGGNIELPQDHKECLEHLKDCEHTSQRWTYYSSKRLLRLDETVIHKVNEKGFTGIRTFVKISVSDHIYALKGNSINPHLPLNVVYKERSIERNCPVTH